MDKMTNSNLFQCNHCKFFVIAEEIETHECKRLKESRFEKNIVWISDGEKWYPLKLSPTESQQRNKTPDDGTEPKILISLRFSLTRVYVMLVNSLTLLYYFETEPSIFR